MTWHTVTKALLSKRPVVKRAEQPVEQPAASCEQTFNWYQPVVQLVWQPVECLFTRCSRLFNRGCQTAQAVEQPVGQPVECLYTLNVCIQDTAGCPTGGQPAVKSGTIWLGTFWPWGTFWLGTLWRDDGTFWKWDVLTVNHTAMLCEIIYLQDRAKKPGHFILFPASYIGRTTRGHCVCNVTYSLATFRARIIL